MSGLLSGLVELGTLAVSSVSKSDTAIEPFKNSLTLADLVKAQQVDMVTSGNVTGAGRGAGAALVADPYLWAFAGDYYVEKPTGVGYSVLRYLCRQDTVLAAIIITRLRQVRAFGQLSRVSETDKTESRGFRVRQRSGAGAKTSVVEAREQELNEFMLRCAVPDEEPEERSFADFLWRFGKDRLTLDQACAEKKLDGAGGLRQFYAVDGGTIRRIKRSRSGMSSGFSFVQIYQGKVVARFEREELMFCPENLSTELDRIGYGESEVEVGLKKVATHLGIDEANARQFHPTSTPKGILTIENAELDDEQMQVLEQRYRRQVATMRGRHRLPILGMPRGGKLGFTRLSPANDMEYRTFLEFLINLLCALYGMDPMEINFPTRSGSLGTGSSLIQSSPELTRLTASKDKGLKPMLGWLAGCINREIIPAIDLTGDFEFSFVGLDSKDEASKAELSDKHTRVWKMVNEEREERGYERVEGLDVVRDPVVANAMAMAKASALDNEPESEYNVDRGTPNAMIEQEEARGVKRSGRQKYLYVARGGEGR